MNEIYENATPTELEHRLRFNYIDTGGNLVRNATFETVMIRSEDDLDSITNAFSIGSIAFTAGGLTRWQLSAARTWEPYGITI